MSSSGKLSKLIWPKFKELQKSSEPILNRLRKGEMNLNKEIKRVFGTECEEQKPKKKDSWIRRWLVERSGHLKYGLYTDDIIDEHIPVVQIALKRIPKEVHDARVFRIVRAAHLNSAGEILPRYMWIKYEEDLEYRYLIPYILDVEKEQQERRNYGDIIEYETNFFTNTMFKA